MRIIISPAKKMKDSSDIFEYSRLPVFLSKTELLLKQLSKLKYNKIKELWNCNDEIAQLNYKRIQNIDLNNKLTPAIFSYEGIQYQYMAPGVFESKELSYIEEHLRILSGFYGMLRPFDGVTPYRLEMQAKLKGPKFKNLYEFWGNQLAKQLFSESSCILNLASKEYSKCITPYLNEGIRFITCIFGECKDDKIVEKGTQVKIARGEMVRFMAENNIIDPEKVKEFDRLNYQYSEALSSDTSYVFIKKIEIN
ncbi:MAG: peroxide stress protein YaaA [Mobilitalea sp.]